MAQGFFFPGADPNVDADTRRKIALAMLAQNRKAYPKTFGEGLASIGDSISDAYIMRQLLEQNAAENKAADEFKSKYTGVTPQTTVEPATYAPPESVPPPLAAINAAAPQGPPIVPAPPPRARTLVPPTAPSGGAVPVAGTGPAGDMVAPGDFNEVDAADPRNRYRAPPAYLAPALERNIVDPERRGYLGQLAGKEAQSPGEVSSTGAAGPFQFTRGTGAQYGIPGNARFDPDASTRAVNAFTDDNVRALTAKLGREPTPGEMALAHQQGAGTAGNMLTGAGNAPANNLAVNNVPAGMGPQAAASKIMGYYGMPGATGVPASPRDAVAAAVTAQQDGGRPSVGDYGQKLALAATPQQAIPAAPPQQQIRAAPQPQQVAQAQQEYPPGYVMADRPKIPPPPTMTPLQQQIEQDLAQRPPATRASDRKAVEHILAREQAKVVQAHEEWKSQQIQDRALQIEQEKQKAASAAAKVEYGSKTSEAVTKATEARIVERTGMKPQELYERLDKDKASVDQTLKAQSAQQLARKAIRDGVITGYGAGTALVGAKFADWAWGNGLKGDLAANTETMSAMLKSGLSEAIKTVNGEGGTGVSNTDVRIAEGMTGSDPQLQLKTIKSIMDRAAEINHRKIGSYEDNVDRYLSGEPAEHRYKTGGSTVPPDKLKLLLENPEQMKSKFDEVYGPGAANLEINRFKRTQARRGKD